jgi:hypothetical protein
MDKESKLSIIITLLFLIFSAATYTVIFLNIDQLNNFYLSKQLFPALCLLGTIIFVSFIYGNAVSGILGHLGIDSDH